MLTIDLDEDIFDDIPSRDQREAIAQIVLTFIYGIDPVGLAVFTFNGSEQNVSVPTGDGLFTNRPVSVDDYASMRVDVEPSGQNETTTPSTTTTVDSPLTTDSIPTITPE